MSAPLLLPRPRRLEPRPDALSLGPGLALDGSLSRHRIEPALDRLAAVLERRGLHLDRDAGTRGAARLHLQIDGSTIRGPEAYALRVDSGGVRIVAATDAGLSHGLSTLAQWLRVRFDSKPPGGQLAGVDIRDRPDLPRRGALLDISRSRVPTMESLFELVDRLAEWKFNQLQLYMEHTFAYRGHETVWKGASPMTPEEIRSLDRFCQQRHVELVPNQNSCGHLHRWLIHEPYRRLAECPDGIEHPFSRRREPFGLCTTDPAALELLEDLYGQLLPCFSSSQVHVGLDETIDLGRCRSRSEAESLGRPELYRRFLCQVHRRVSRQGYRMQFWGDIVAAHPDLLPEVPDDAIVMEWGYEADHDFVGRAEQLAAAGLEFYLCPGTSSWLSFAGRLDNARRNIAAAVRAAGRYGAAGVLVTDWGDQGHLQPLPASLPGLLLAAGLAWRGEDAGRPESVRVADILATHVLSGEASDPTTAAGRLITLADLYRVAGGRAFNGSPLFHLLLRPDLPLSDRRFEGLTPADLKRCLETVANMPGCADTDSSAPLVDREIAWMRDALSAGALAGSIRLDEDHRGTAKLVDALDDLIARHGDLWLERSRPGGRDESRWHLEDARRRFAEHG